MNLKIFFSRSTEPISTKLSTMHLWVKGIQVCSNEGPRPFSREDNNEIAEIHWQNLNIFFSRTDGLISTKLGTKHPWVKGIQVVFKWRAQPFSRRDKRRNSENSLTELKTSSPEPLSHLNQIWHNAFLGDEDSILLKWNGPHLFFQGR